ncbi:MAG: glycosyltransferase family 9 protein [Bacteroidales bacterium]|jgi:heptosyltransferase-2|nr:glycosyltransferase family 9 protein [Bacteroidales bacterium]
MRKIKKLLIIRFSSIGDIVLTTPIVRCLKKQRPDIELHYLTKESNAQILENNPYLDRIIHLKGSLNETIRALKKEKYDIVIDLHKNLRSLIIRYSLLKPFYSYPTLRFKKWLMVKFKINLLPKEHIVDRYFLSVKPIGIENDNLGLDYFISDEDLVALKTLPFNFESGYIVFVVGGKHKTKQIPTNILIELCNRINYPVILLGDNSDKEKANIIMDNSKESSIINACGIYNLNQSAALIKYSKGVITPDSGLMHIASAMDKNIISLWGNTTPAFGMSPYMSKLSKSKVYIIENLTLKCRPCHRLGYNKCPKKHFLCMNSINVDEILNIVSSWEKDKN